MRRSLATVMAVVAACAVVSTAHAQTVYHVSKKGNDQNPGTAAKPLVTISAAAALAQPGDTVTVHAGTYRERIDPPRGGESEAKRVTYQAAPGEKVEIKGSEVVTGWKKVQDDTWTAAVPNTVFGTFNPYVEVVRGDWFDPRGRVHHTGAVYLDGASMVEALELNDLLKPARGAPFWFSKVTKDSTTIWAQFQGVNPNDRLVEINARQSIFYPTKTGINYLTVRGFVMQHAASPWAPPTAEQIGLIGTHWSKGWIIEKNVISQSKNVCITLGKYGDEWDNRAQSAEGYVGTIRRALAHGWVKDAIGHHLVRDNVIFECGQAGIVGSLGAIFSTITRNVIHDIHRRQLFSGAEVGGIKLHGAIDVAISYNHIYQCAMGLWLDWMAQGTRVEGNLFHDNVRQDMFIEVNHGPYLLDNNIFLSKVTLWDMSEGGAFAHNLIGGRIFGGEPEGRKTPYFAPHTIDLVDIVSITGGDMRYQNNLFVRNDALGVYDRVKPPVSISGNVFLNGGPAAASDSASRTSSGGPVAQLRRRGEEYYLELTPSKVWSTDSVRPWVTTETLGQATVPRQAFENFDGSPLIIDLDYFGRRRGRHSAGRAGGPAAGPFDFPVDEKVVVKVWPRDAASTP